MEGKAKNTKTGAERTVKASEKQVERWILDSVVPCSGPCRCDVEPDGVCPNGWPSRLRALGMV